MHLCVYVVVAVGCRVQAVAGVHEQRIVHSDLKPANFLLVEGQLKLIDFGIAKAISGDTTSIARESQVGGGWRLAAQRAGTACHLGTAITQRCRLAPLAIPCWGASVSTQTTTGLRVASGKLCL